MTNDAQDFIDALENFVRAELAEVETIRVVDARNHLFCQAGKRMTDEGEDIFALRDLCYVDEETMEMRPDRGRMAAVARNFFS